MAREQALRDSLPEFYVDAVDRARRRRDRAAGDRDHRRCRKTATSSSRRSSRCARRCTSSGYDELRVELPFDGDRRRRDRRPGRPAARSLRRPRRLRLSADRRRRTRSIDIAGSIDGEPVEGLTATDFLYRVGSDMVVPELDEQLRGTRPGAILEFTATLPERFGERAGEEVDLPRDREGSEAARCCPSSPTSGSTKRASSTRSTSCAPTSASGSN